MAVPLKFQSLGNIFSKFSHLVRAEDINLAIPVATSNGAVSSCESIAIKMCHTDYFLLLTSAAELKELKKFNMKHNLLLPVYLDK